MHNKINKNNNLLSSVIVCSNPISMEYTLRETILSISPISDEIILINADMPNKSEVNDVVNSLPHGVLKRITIYKVPWSYSLGKNEYWLLKSLAIGLASNPYILRLDADEVLLDTFDNYNKIRKAIEFGYDSYKFRVTHFWKDYNHIVDSNNHTMGYEWYDRRIYLFKNGNGYYENEYDICDSDGKVLTNSKNTSIQVMHYGHVRSKEVYLKKKNQIEKAYHSDWKELKDWNWDVVKFKKFEGEHPSIMENRTRKGIND